VQESLYNKQEGNASMSAVASVASLMGWEFLKFTTRATAVNGDGLIYLRVNRPTEVVKVKLILLVTNDKKKQCK
jgi:hypothetical protein